MTENDIKNSTEEVAEEALREIGVTQRQKVLDFGCGSGNYTMPAAKIVGNGGVVYALDKDKNVLDGLMEKAKSFGLGNIRRVDRETKTGLDDESVDVILIYDVLSVHEVTVRRHEHYFSQVDDRREALDEIYRIAKPDALISIYPTHMEMEKLKSEIESADFCLKSEYSGTLVLHGKLEEGQLLNFGKEKQNETRVRD